MRRCEYIPEHAHILHKEKTAPSNETRSYDHTRTAKIAIEDTPAFTFKITLIKKQPI